MIKWYDTSKQTCLRKEKIKDETILDDPAYDDWFNWFKINRYESILSSFETWGAVWCSSTISSRFFGLPCLSPIYRQAVAANVKNEQRESHLDQVLDSVVARPVRGTMSAAFLSPQAYALRRELCFVQLSALVPREGLGLDISYSVRHLLEAKTDGQLWSACQKTRNEIDTISLRIARMSSSRSHSSKCIYTNNEARSLRRCLPQFQERWRLLNFSNWSFRALSEMAGSVLIRFLMPVTNAVT